MVEYAKITEHYAGFESYQTGEWTTYGTESGEFGGTEEHVQAATIDDWIGYKREQGFFVERDTQETNAKDGLVRGQSGGEICAVTDHSDAVYYYCLIEKQP